MMRPSGIYLFILPKRLGGNIKINTTVMLPVILYESLKNEGHRKERARENIYT
jgi:hypothetical protein